MNYYLVCALRNGVTSYFVSKVVKFIDSSVVGSVMTNVVSKL